jgi:hypothetical protein
MPNTFTLIQAVTLSSTQSAINFTSIPATYTDLCIKSSLKNPQAESSVGYNWLGMRFNGSTATYIGRSLGAVNNTIASDPFSDTQFRQFANDNNSWQGTNNWSNNEIYIFNYANGNGSSNKPIQVESAAEFNSAGGASVQMFNGRWPSTDAISSISLYDLDQNLLAGSSAYLYGIVKS